MIEPPKRSLRFLRWFCREDFIDELEGDMIEIYQKEYAQSPRHAKRNFTMNVLRHFRPAFIKTFRSDSSQKFLPMFRHNILIALRSFMRSKTSFIINVVGLSTGLACTLLIYLWVMAERDVDHFNDKDKRLYQVLENNQTPHGVFTGSGTQGPLAAAMANEIPEVEHAVTVVSPPWFSNECAVTFNDAHVKGRPQFVSKDYFNVFTCKILRGSPENPIPDMNSIMVSRQFAQRLFQTDDDVIGKTVSVSLNEFTDQYHISGVFEDIPENASVPFDILFAFDKFVSKREGMLNYRNSDPETFLILKEGVDVDAFNKKIAGFVMSKEPKSKDVLFVQRFSDRYLHGSYENGAPSGGKIFYVQLLTVIGAFILIIACINFMNISTANATRRMKEVGVKKSIGASRTSLISQYLTESMIITVLSLVIAIGMAILILPGFNHIIGKNLSIKIDPVFLIIAFSTMVFTSILAGSYPALYLSSFNPSVVLKGKIRASFGELLARKGLVIFQFTISVILMTGVWILYRQMDFIQKRNLGYKKDNIIVVNLSQTPLERLSSFRTEIEKIPGVISAGSFYHNLSGDHGNIELNWEGKQADQKIDFANLEVGFGFMETMSIEFREGRPFTQSEAADNEIILNETAVKFMSLKDPIGKTITFWDRKRQIVGITKDFNFESLHEKVKPCFFQAYPFIFNWVIKVEGGREQETLAGIEDVYKKFSEGYPFDYHFLDESYQKLYASEQRMSVLSRYFASIAIVISCLGLFALAAFTAEKRQKEIGIRKVLGSSQAGIVFLLSSDFMKVIFVSIVTALPVSYLIAKLWLDSFAFRITLEWYYFAGTGIAALLIAWITISGHTFKASNINPAECLKSE